MEETTVTHEASTSSDAPPSAVSVVTNEGVASSGIAVRVSEWLRTHRMEWGVLAVFLLILLASATIDTEPRHEAVKKFTNVYSFVPEKISQSAPIPVSLPEGVTEEEARASVTFSPEIEGVWADESIEGTLIYHPEEPLRSHVYYAVNLETATVQMSGDFYVDDDPKIVALVPAVGSEADEHSEITIMFNRPMVPLTTLSLQEEKPLPITITPETKGRFKWISTRTLQFIPETTLIPSSDYTVRIGEGFTSVDGLAIEPFTHTFFTRPLRYEYLSEGHLSFRAPITIAFTQPVDFDETVSKVQVEKQGGGSVPLDIEFGERTYTDDRGKEITETDERVLKIYPKEDAHGRRHVWDFETSYVLSIEGAVPKEGMRELRESRTKYLTVPDIVSSMEARSERTSLVRPDLFDPQGTLVVHFMDEVDIDRSRFTAKGIRSVTYGEQCKTDDFGEVLNTGSGCEKEQNHSEVHFAFNESVFSEQTGGNTITLTLERIETKDGFTANANPVSIDLKRYPAFDILRTIPDSGTTTAPLDEMFVCTNVPLQDPGEEGLDRFIDANSYMVFGDWSESTYITTKNNWSHCESGEFETRLSYGIHPDTEYHVKLSLSDVFGGTANREVSFRTRPAESQYTRFHNLQKQYNVTTPGKTKLTYAAENLEYVDLHICKMTPEAFLEATVIRAGDKTPPRSDVCTEVKTEQVQLPSRYWVNNYFQVNLANYFSDTKGHYILTFSNPLYVDDYYGGQRYDRTYVSVTNLAVGQKQVEHYEKPWSDQSRPEATAAMEAAFKEQSNLYWVVDSTTLAPKVGAMVTQYTGGEVYGETYPFKAGVAGFTGGDGIAQVPILSRVAGAVVRLGTDTAVITDWSDTLYDSWYSEDASRTYIYTDRPIYRPTQTVHIRGIDRIGYDGSYTVWNKDPVTLKLFDSENNQIYETPVSVSTYGTFDASFELPKDTPLGTYRIEVLSNSAYFSVEEYVPAAFKLDASSNKEEYTSGDTIQLDVQADYYFGVPLDGGTVTYSVTAQDYHFDRYTDEYFNFGGSWYYCYYCDYGDEFLFRGQTSLNQSGRATIERAFDFDEYFSDEDDTNSKLVTVTLTAQDSGGRSVSTQKSFIVHRGEFYLGARTDDYYVGVGQPQTLRIKSVSQQGEPVAISGIERIVSSVSWNTFKRQEVDGGFYYRSEKVLKEISRDTVRTDSSGDWVGTLTFPEEGRYEVSVRKTDTLGNGIETTITMYVYGTDAVVVPPTNNYELEIETERAEYDVGDTASLLLKFPYDRAKVLITAERGFVYDYWIADVQGGLYHHEFPVTSEYSPNVHVSALLLAPNPEVKFGSVEFAVGRDEHELQVEVTVDKSEYLPGESVTLSVQTTDHLGKPIPAEVSIAVADLSVLALRGNPKKNPLVFFYDGFPLSVTTASNIKNVLYEKDIPLGTKGGGGDPEDLAAKKRGIFKDTAFWQGDVVTDANGKATVTFTLPDNLTTWQVETLGVTEDTKLGVDYQEFVTGKKLMAVPLKPRFVVPGDTFYIGAKLFNETGARKKIDVSITSDTLEFLGETKDSASVNDGETDTVYFEVRAPEDMRGGAHVFTITAVSDDLVDAVEQEIKVTPNETYETVATANTTKDDVAREYLYVPDTVLSGQGGLTINANATLAVFMTDALTYMASYPYGCSEQLASALSTIASIQSALTIPGVEGSFETIEFNGTSYSVDAAIADGLSHIYANQSIDGGFSYYQGMEPDLYLTLHVVQSMAKLKDAGYEVKEEVFNRALQYIEIEASTVYRQYSYGYGNRELVVFAEYVLRILGKRGETGLTDFIRTLVKDDSFIHEDASSMTLAYLAMLTNEYEYGWGVAKETYETITNRIEYDGRGAYLAPKGSGAGAYYHSTVVDTALLLKVFALREDEHPSIGNMLRWLLAGRDDRGVWGSTHNTFFVIDGMVSYLKWQHETESHFTLRGALDGVELFTHEFKKENIFETFTHFVPIDSLRRKTLMPLTFDRERKTEEQHNLYYDIALSYYLPTESIPPRDEGITITRELFRLTDTVRRESVTEATVGEILRGRLRIGIPGMYNHVAVEDYIPAGFELVNFNLATEDQSLMMDDVYGENSERSGFMSKARGYVGQWFDQSPLAQTYGASGGRGASATRVKELVPTHVESHDDRVFFYVDQISPGLYEYEYFIRALVPGAFQQLPAKAEELYTPEVFGRTSGDIITVSLPE